MISMYDVHMRINMSNKTWEENYFVWMGIKEDVGEDGNR